MNVVKFSVILYVVYLKYFVWCYFFLLMFIDLIGYVVFSYRSYVDRVSVVVVFFVVFFVVCVVVDVLCFVVVFFVFVFIYFFVVVVC